MLDLYYVLDDQGDPVVEPNFDRWAEWFADNFVRRIDRTQVDDADVSTVFLGVDHQWGDGPPLLFETMIFGGRYDGHQWRWSTRQAAIDGHTAVVKALTVGGDLP